MAMEHWLVARNPELDALGYVLMMKSGADAKWTVLPGGAPKSRWAKEALGAAVKQGIAIDVTINPGSPRAVMADPEAIAAEQDLTVVCRESPRDRARWSIVTMDAAGNFRLLRTVVGIGIEGALEELAGSISDSPLDKAVFWLRPDWFATDILPAAVSA